jgi:hypothetical protein
MLHLLVTITPQGVHTFHRNFFTGVIEEKSTESVVGYPSGLGMCACCRSQLEAQTGDCCIQLSRFQGQEHVH